jgi:hypothetical protein
MTNDLGVLVRNANPVPTVDHLCSDELDAALAAIETSLAGQAKQLRAMSFFQRFRTRPTVVFVTALAVVVLAVAVPLFLFGTSEGDVMEPVTSTMAPVTTTADPTTTTTAVTTTEAVTPTTVAVVPPVVAPTITWTRVPDQPAFENAGIGEYDASLVEYDSGLVGIGHVWNGRKLDRLHAAMFVSADGLSWDRIDDPWSTDGEFTFLSDVAVGPDATLVAVGGNLSDAAIWASPDGFEWSRIVSDALGGPDAQTVFGVVAGGPGFVAVGDDGSNAAVWVSPDGYAWSKVEDADLLAGEAQSVAMFSVTTGGPGLVAVGRAVFGDTDAEPAAWVSADGFDWSRLPGETFAAESGYYGFEKVTRHPTSGLLIGFAAQTWTSVDGYDWAITAAGEEFGAPPPGAEVAWSGDVGVAAAVDRAISLWVSGDAGVTWTEVDTDQPVFEGYRPQVRAVVELDGQFIVAGEAGAYLSEVGAVWIGTLEE